MGGGDAAVLTGLGCGVGGEGRSYRGGWGVWHEMRVDVPIQSLCFAVFGLKSHLLKIKPK